MCTSIFFFAELSQLYKIDLKIFIYYIFAIQKKIIQNRLINWKLTLLINLLWFKYVFITLDNPHLTNWFYMIELDEILNSKMISNPLHNLLALCYQVFTTGPPSSFSHRTPWISYENVNGWWLNSKNLTIDDSMNLNSNINLEFFN
jgi:hypothetical protein